MAKRPLDLSNEESQLRKEIKLENKRINTNAFMKKLILMSTK